MEQAIAHLLAPRVVVPRSRVPSRTGRVAAASFDEDATTLAVEAAAATLGQLSDEPTGLALATVSSPFAEGGIGQVVAEALGLRGDLVVQEFGGSIAAAGGALIAAAGQLATFGGPVLVVATDTRRDRRGRPIGDGAVAAALTRHPGGHAATIQHLGSRAAAIRDHWRRDGEDGVSSADGSLLKALPSPHPREQLAEAGGTPVLVGPDEPTLPRVGVLGTPGLLVHGLCALGSGQRMPVSVGAGGVSHAFLLTPGPAAEDTVEHLRQHLDAGADAERLSIPEVEGFEPFASQPRSWRERAQDLRLDGQRDPDSGEVLFPPVPARAARGLERYRLQRTGTVVTFTRDHVFPYGGPLSMAIADIDGGGRFFGQVADAQEVAIGDRVELVLRKLHDGGGLPHYYYKLRPVTPSRTDD